MGMQKQNNKEEMATDQDDRIPIKITQNSVKWNLLEGHGFGLDLAEILIQLFLIASQVS